MESIKKPNKGIWAFWLICTYFCLGKQPTEIIHRQSKPNYTKENQHLPLVSNGAELETINAHKFSHTHMQRYVRPFFLLSVRVLLNCMCVPHCYGAVHSTSTRDTCGFLLHQMHANRVILLRSWANTKTPICDQINQILKKWFSKLAIVLICSGQFAKSDTGIGCKASSVASDFLAFLTLLREATAS